MAKPGGPAPPARTVSTRARFAAIWAARLKGPIGTLLFFLQRMSQDDIANTAAALCYSTSLAVIPALALILGTMAAFPAFDRLREQVQAAITANLVPTTGVRMQDQLTHFISAADTLTIFGVIGLAVTAILLLLTIESALNRIFRVAHPRPMFMRVVVLWTVLTVAPFLIGISATVFGTFRAAFGTSDGILGEVLLGHVTPALVSWAALTLLYRVVPNRAVDFRDAAIGAGTTAVLLEGLRLGFAIYVGRSTYSAIYGAVAAVPVFLVWIYCLWITVLAGAVIAAALPDWRLLRTGHGSGPGLKLAVGLAIIDLLAAMRRHGGGLRPEEISARIEVPPAGVLPVLDELRRARYVTMTDQGCWVICRDLHDVPLAHLVHHFGLGIGPALTELRGTALGARISAYLEPAAQAEGRLLNVCLEELLAPADRGKKNGSAKAEPSSRPDRQAEARPLSH